MAKTNSLKLKRLAADLTEMRNKKNKWEVSFGPPGEYIYKDDSGRYRWSNGPALTTAERESFLNELKEKSESSDVGVSHHTDDLLKDENDLPYLKELGLTLDQWDYFKKEAMEMLQYWSDEDSEERFSAAYEVIMANLKRMMKEAKELKTSPEQLDEAGKMLLAYLNSKGASSLDVLKSEISNSEDLSEFYMTLFGESELFDLLESPGAAKVFSDFDTKASELLSSENVSNFDNLTDENKNKSLLEKMKEFAQQSSALKDEGEVVTETVVDEPVSNNVSKKEMLIALNEDTNDLIFAKKSNGAKALFDKLGVNLHSLTDDKFNEIMTALTSVLSDNYDAMNVNSQTSDSRADAIFDKVFPKLLEKYKSLGSVEALAYYTNLYFKKVASMRL